VGPKVLLLGLAEGFALYLSDEEESVTNNCSYLMN
jgi:hypothetical protein